MNTPAAPEHKPPPQLAGNKRTTGTRAPWTAGAWQPPSSAMQLTSPPARTATAREHAEQGVPAPGAHDAASGVLDSWGLLRYVTLYRMYRPAAAPVDLAAAHGGARGDDLEQKRLAAAARAAELDSGPDIRSLLQRADALLAEGPHAARRVLAALCPIDVRCTEFARCEPSRSRAQAVEAAERKLSQLQMGRPGAKQAVEEQQVDPGLVPLTDEQEALVSASLARGAPDEALVSETFKGTGCTAAWQNLALTTCALPRRNGRPRHHARKFRVHARGKMAQRRGTRVAQAWQRRHTAGSRECARPVRRRSSTSRLACCKTASCARTGRLHECTSTAPSSTTSCMRTVASTRTEQCSGSLRRCGLRVVCSRRLSCRRMRSWTTEKRLGYCILDCDLVIVPVHQARA